MAVDGLTPLAAGTILAGLLIAILFVRRQRWLADPMIDISLLRNPQLGAALTINLVGLFVVLGTFLFIAQYLQLVLGLTPMQAGLWTAPSGVAFAAGSILAPRLVKHFTPGAILACGFLVAAVGFGILTQLGRTDSPLLLFCGMLILCSGLAPVGALTTDLVMSAAPPHRAGAASAISETSFELGGALGIALLGSVVAAVYRSIMAGADLSGAPVEAAQAARDTLGAGVAVARELGGERGNELLATVRSAFVHAFEVSSGIAAAGVLVAALLAAVLLRHTALGSDR